MPGAVYLREYKEGVLVQPFKMPGVSTIDLDDWCT
jgi:hypothetical protein